MSVGLCLGFRYWNREHLERCLAWLAPCPYPLVIADLGSAPPLRRMISDLRLKPRPTTVIEVPATEWSRSVALNRAAATHGAAVETLVFTDADMLFPSSWFAALTRALAQPRGAMTLWLTDSRDLPQGWEGRPVTGHDPDGALWALSDPHPRVGEGAAMVVPRAWFTTVGGFDEYYRVWGAEDNDLTMRARWAGLAVEWIPEAWVAHQWHRRDWPTPGQFQQVAKNRQYLASRVAEQGPIVRNRESRKEVPLR
jgi:hypothetical protein